MIILSWCNQSYSLPCSEAAGDMWVQELEIFTTQQGVSTSQPPRLPLQPCNNLPPSQTPSQSPSGVTLKQSQQQQQQQDGLLSPAHQQQSFQYFAFSQPAMQASDTQPVTALHTDSAEHRTAVRQHHQQHQQQQCLSAQPSREHSQQMVLAGSQQGNHGSADQATAQCGPQVSLPSAHNDPGQQGDPLQQHLSEQGQLARANGSQLRAGPSPLHGHQQGQSLTAKPAGRIGRGGGTELLHTLQHLRYDSSMWGDLKVCQILWPCVVFGRCAGICKHVARGCGQYRT